VRRGEETARPNWSTTNDLICRGVTRPAVGLAVLAFAVVGLAVVVVAVVVLAVVVLAVVGLAVVGLAVVVLAVVGLAVVGLAVVGLEVVTVTVLAGSTTEFVLDSPLDLGDSTVRGLSVRIWTSSSCPCFSSGEASFLGFISFLVGRKKVSENLSAVRAGAAGWTGSLTGAGAGLLTPNL